MESMALLGRGYALTLILLLAGTGVTSVPAAPQKTTLVRPAAGVIVAAADYSFYNYINYGHARLETAAQRVQKILDLAEISAADFAAVQRARVSLFMYAEDGAGDGLDGALHVVVNGHQETFPTKDLISQGWGWFDTRQAINWFDFDIPPEHLIHGRNEIVVYPSAHPESDDRLVVGIDMFQDQRRSARSTDGGTNWQRRPLSKDGFGGEYMLRLVLLSNQVDVTEPKFSHEDFPVLPPIDMCPEVKPLPTLGTESPRMLAGETADTFVNSAMTVEIRHEQGLQLSRLDHHAMNVPAIAVPASKIPQWVDQIQSELAEVKAELRAQQLTWEETLKTRMQQAAYWHGGWWSTRPFIATDQSAAHHDIFPPEEQLDGQPADLPWDDGEMWSFEKDWEPGQTHTYEEKRPAAVYAYHPIFANRKATLRLSFVADDGMKFWHDGQVVYDRMQVTDDGQNSRDIELHPGLNHLFFKASNGGGAFHFTVKMDYVKATEAAAPQLVDIAGHVAAILHTPRPQRSEIQSQLLEEYHFAVDGRISALRKRLNEEPTRETLFVLDLEGQRLSASDFIVDRKEVLQASAEQVSVVYDLSYPPAQLTARLRITMDRSRELLLGFSLQNHSTQNQVVRAAFPVLSGIGWSEGFQQDRYLYPLGTGIVLDHPARFRSGYGGGRTYFQTMASYCPEMGGGLYLRVNDQSGEYKILHMLKADARESDPTFKMDPLLTDARNGRAPSELIFWDPLVDVAGTSMAFSYFGRDLQPQEQWRFANATLGVMNGDWHEAMRAYRKWFESFSHKNKYPNKLTDAFNYDSTGPEWGYRGPGDKRAYNSDPTKWGHRVMGHVADDFMTKIVDGLEHSGYWEHEEITEKMLAEHKATAAKYGLPFKLWPGRHGMLEGKNVLWGNQGDYGLTGYNKRWGGLSTFRKYIAELKSKGYIPTFYINKAEAAFNSVMGRKHGPEWATMYPEGNYFWPYHDWQMCMDHQPWREYLAQTCARIIEETGGDGVRIDEMGGAARICQNKQHTHTFARWRHYNELQAQSDAARQVRRAMDGVNPDSVLLTESLGFDVLGQYVDGSLLYDLTEQGFTSGVAANWEGFVGINIYRFFFPRHKIFDYQISEKYPEWRLFNATGAFNREWCYREHERQMLKDNADAFGSLEAEPMIATRIPRVYGNRFPAGHKTVYTLYNAASQAARGPLLALPTRAEYHWVDLYRYAEVATAREADQTVVSLALEPRSVTCVAHLRKQCDVIRQGSEVVVQTRGHHEGARVRIADLFGKKVAVGTIQNGRCKLSLPPDTGRLLCKLYQDKYLVDAVPLNASEKSR